MALDGKDKDSHSDLLYHALAAIESSCCLDTNSGVSMEDIISTKTSLNGKINTKVS
jgi:hypothetical protein